MKYEDYSFNSKTEVENLLNSDDELIRATAIVGMLNGISDKVWLEKKLLELAMDESFWVAKNAIDGLGDLARMKVKLDVKKITDTLNKINRVELNGVIKCLMDDIETFQAN